MNITYKTDDTLKDNEIIILCKKMTPKILEVEQFLNTNTINSIFGEKDSKVFPINSNTVEIIYSENRKTVVRSKGELYESKNTLMKFENILPRSFVRISKSVIANTKHIKSIEAEFSGNYTLIFLSGNREILSRSYVKNLKSAIGMEWYYES